MRNIDESRAVSQLLMLVTFTLAIVGLYVAKEVLLPFALAIFFSFILTPVSSWLERLRIGRIASVIVVTGITFVFLAGLTWLVTEQTIQLGAKLPEYRANLLAKARSAKASQQELGKVAQTIQDVGKELMGESAASPGDKQKGASQSRPSESSATTSTSSGKAAGSEAVPVEVVATPAAPLRLITDWLGPLLAPVTQASIVVVLTLFMLIQREDLRDRILRLFGSENLYTTTQALDDVSGRLGRYLRMQLLINGGYGLIVGVTLYFIGLPVAILFGVLTMLLRFLPYIGVWIAAGMPILVSLAVFNGWLQPMLTIGLFVALELGVAYVLEPYAYGSSIGVSAITTLLAAIFWTWLWGSVGLVLAVPLTVCLVVIARYVPELHFLELLMGDRPTLPPEQRIYQRLLAMDYDEAEELAEEYLKSSTLQELYDNVLLPVLSLLAHDRYAGVLDNDREAFLVQSIHDLVEELGPQPESVVPAPHLLQANDAHQGALQESRPRVLCVPIRGGADEVVVAMLRQLFQVRGLDVELGGVESLTSEVVDRVAEKTADIVVISLLPPLSTRDGRYLCKRLRDRYPDLPIIAGLWKGEDLPAASKRLRDSGANHVVTTLGDAIAKASAIASNLPGSRNGRQAEQGVSKIAGDMHPQSPEQLHQAL
jgi:predicted PurR-regulated permease PerM/methylmalonyl-CoA mutase cobalamin-binding subunit